MLKAITGQAQQDKPATVTRYVRRETAEATI